jgi:hypothetical protein
LISCKLVEVRAERGQTWLAEAKAVFRAEYVTWRAVYSGVN